MNSLTIYHGTSKPIKATGKHQTKLLSFAFRFPCWHTFTNDRTTKRAVKALEAKGCLEVIGDQFKFKYPKG